MTQTIIAESSRAGASPEEGSLEAASLPRFDVVVVGGGAAGLAAAIFAARAAMASRRRLRILIADGAKSLGAKILISGGSRCNVTNTQVGAGDFWQAGSPFVRHVLRAFTGPETIAFFDEIGVSLCEEPLGKLFPTTNKSRTVLDALLAEAARLFVEIRVSCRVLEVAHESGAFLLRTSQGVLSARQVVLATGGLSLPKTGSDGAGYAIARGFGHTIVPPVPALEPLIMSGDFHAPISGIAHEATIRIARSGAKSVRLRGSLLWTHFGVSGPLALDASRFRRRGRADSSTVEMSLSFLPDLTEKESRRQG